jgi:hypothetical protein
MCVVIYTQCPACVPVFAKVQFQALRDAELRGNMTVLEHDCVISLIW